MVLKLYFTLGSPPCRAVAIIAKMLGVNLEIKTTILGTDTPNFKELLQVNPNGTVPTLDDDGKILSDSHAINTYLIEKYDPDNSLYPKDIYKRALVQEKFHFDTGSLFAPLQIIWFGIIGKEFKIAPDSKLVRLHKAYNAMENYLTKNKWVCSDDMTLADISIFTTLTSAHEVAPIDELKYTHIWAWIKQIQALPFVSGDEAAMKAYLEWLNKIQQ